MYFVYDGVTKIFKIFFMFKIISYYYCPVEKKSRLFIFRNAEKIVYDNKLYFNVQ